MKSFHNPFSSKSSSRNPFGKSLPQLLETKKGRADETSNVPDALLLFIQYISRDHVIQTEGLFRVPGSMKLVKEIKAEMMKKGPEIIWEHNRPGEASEICSLMKQWLREIPEGLIFGSSYEGFVKASDSSQDMISAAQKIVEPYRSTIIHLLRFLLLVTEHQASNKMSRTNMAIIFGPSLFKSPSRTGEYNSSDSSSALAENFLHVKWTEFLLSDFHTIFEPGTSKVQKLQNDNAARKENIIEKKLSLVVENAIQDSEWQADDLDCHIIQSAESKGYQTSDFGKSNLLSPIEEKSEFSVAPSQESGPSRPSTKSRIRPPPLFIQGENGLIDIEQNPTQPEPDLSALSSAVSSAFASLPGSNTSKTATEADLPPLARSAGRTKRRERQGASKSVTEDYLGDGRDRVLHNPSMLQCPPNMDQVLFNMLKAEYNQLYCTVSEGKMEQELKRMREILALLGLNKAAVDSAKTLTGSPLTSPIRESASPLVSSMHRILDNRQSLNRPQCLEDMTIEQMLQERRFIKTELIQLKRYFESAGGEIRPEDQDILKRMMVWYHELKTRLNSRVQFSPGPSPTDADVTAALKYEKQLLKIRLHQFQLEFSESHNGKRPSSKEDFGESIYREYRRYKELRVMLKDDSA